MRTDDRFGSGSRPEVPETKTVGRFFKKFWWLIPLAGILIFGLMWVLYNNGFAAKESQLIALDKKFESTLALRLKGVGGQDKVFEKTVAAMKEVAHEYMSGRFGPGGSQAAMQWLQEHNVNISPDMYKPLQEALEAMFAELESIQNARIDVARVYVPQLEDNIPSKYFASWQGYPKHMTIDEMRRIISSDDARKAMESGRLPDLPL